MMEQLTEEGRFDAELRRGAQVGELMLQRCIACGHLPNFPRVACPVCFGPLRWFLGDGRGLVDSFTIVWRTHKESLQPLVPIVLASIVLREGVVILSTIVGTNRVDVQVQSPVRVVRGWSQLPQFSLDGGGEVITARV